MLKRLLITCVLACVLLAGGSARGAGTGYVYAYFKGGWPTGGSSGVFLSYSFDGLHFEPMNDDNPVLFPPQPPEFPSGENLTRDPSVIYGPDGWYHMVWTSGITTRTIGYSSSQDLMNWSTPQRVEIWNPNVVVDNTWAPEILYDDVLGQYQIVFASDLNNNDHKLYSITTDDFATYSNPNVFYYNNATVIDGMIAKDSDNNQYLMALKDEQGGQKNIRLSTAPTAQGPWTTSNPVIVGPGSLIEPNQTEGPSLLKIDDTWHLYYDAYGAGYLGVATSTDPNNPFSWTNMTGQSTMPDGHHGTVFAAPIDSIAFELLPYSRSDLNGDETIDIDDWLIFSDYHLTDLDGLSRIEQAARGDLDRNSTNDYYDFRLFQSDYDTFNGIGMFQVMLSSVAVPEPSVWVLLAMSICVLPSRILRKFCCHEELGYFK
jgi:Glycosyl hydrolases family 43